MEYYSASICMDLQGIMLGEISQAGKDKYCMMSLICEIKKKKVILTETENRKVVA